MPSQLWSREYFQLLPGPVAGYGKVLCQGLVLFLAVTGNSSVGPCLRGPLVCHRFSVLDLGLWRSLGQGPAGTFSPSPSCLCSLCLTLSAFGLEVSKAVVPNTGFLSSLGGGFWGDHLVKRWDLPLHSSAPNILPAGLLPQAHLGSSLFPLGSLETKGQERSRVLGPVHSHFMLFGQKTKPKQKQHCHSFRMCSEGRSLCFFFKKRDNLSAESRVL
jgi:hypothetical protein